MGAGRASKWSCPSGVNITSAMLLSSLACQDLSMDVKGSTAQLADSVTGCFVPTYDKCGPAWKIRRRPCSPLTMPCPAVNDSPHKANAFPAGKTYEANPMLRCRGG